MRRSHALFLGLLFVQSPGAGSAAAAGSDSRALTRKERLGRELFFDTNLSSPPGQSCASCHDPAAAFTDPDRAAPTSKGADPALHGNRNAPTAAYSAFSPPFHFDKKEELYVGGQFLDGRAASLKAQAKMPLLNPVEMANPDAAAVVDKVRQAPYAALFRKVYGGRSLHRTGPAYDRIADAIASFERTPAFQPFTSKYDYYLKGQARFTAAERRGRALFENPEKGNCAACHPDRPAADGKPPLFTDFTYDNIGVPRNGDSPFLRLPREFNPEERGFTDRGLGGVLRQPKEDGKFKVPTLRNIARTAPYTHNGYFRTLRGVVEFYSNRDIKPACPNPLTPEAEALEAGCWPVPEVAENLNRTELGALALSDREIDDLVAFLATLTDGYRPE